MYSLEQVIYFLEQRQQTEDWNIRDAAIAYLKGYREILPEFAQLKLDAVNAPLTWEQLKSMEGKPVWVEPASEWVLVSGVEENRMYLVTQTCNEYSFYKEEMIEHWQAYRKER